MKITRLTNDQRNQAIGMLNSGIGQERGGGVMAWGAINAHFRLQMVIVPGNLNARDNIANILRLVLFPLVRQHGGNWRHMFQHDDARPILPGLHNISYETTMLLSCSGLPDHRI